MIESSDPDERARKRNNRPLSLSFSVSLPRSLLVSSVTKRDGGDKRN